MSSDMTGNILYFSHGGGPLPLLGDWSHAAMVDFMKRLPRKLDRYGSILVISAHWEEPHATLLGHESPSMLYDYYGFPAKAYEFDYPAPGNPALAEYIRNTLEDNGVQSRIDPQRGFDHGSFIPLSLMYPDADIPVIQLSLINGLSPYHHLELGRSMRKAIDDSVLVIGSGFSFHNMREFYESGTKQPDYRNNAFQDWLIDICTGTYTQEDREHFLTEWERAPNSRYCHPREEHLMPLLVCQSLAGRAGEVIFDDYILGKRSLAFRW